MDRAAPRNDLVDASIVEWRRIVEARDWDALPALLTDDVTYHNPSQIAPLRGKEALLGALKRLSGIFVDFGYMRAFSGREGHVLEFSARVGDAPFTGVDILRFDETGRLADLTVIVRPVSAVIALGEEAGRRIAEAGHQSVSAHHGITG